MQQTGLEWIFRLLQEPRRLFRRYVTGLWVFGWAILRQVRQMRVRRSPAASGPFRITPMPDAGAIVVKLPATLDATTARASYSTWRQLPCRSADIVLDAGGLESVDSTGVGMLIRLQCAMREDGRQLVLAAPCPALVRTLELMKFSEFFTLAADIPAALELAASRRRECSVAIRPAPPGKSHPILWQGEITAVNVDEVALATASRMAGASGAISIDLSAVRFIDSSGIGLMVKLRKQASHRNVDLAFVGASENVRNVARLLRLEAYLFENKS
jgi:N-acetylglucosaminyldiphosphoundecaprenol N-acetyl-beta-D-mannosaminyltransferase